MPRPASAHAAAATVERPGLVGQPGEHAVLEAPGRLLGRHDPQQAVDDRAERARPRRGTPCSPRGARAGSARSSPVTMSSARSAAWSAPRRTVGPVIARPSRSRALLVERRPGPGACPVRMRVLAVPRGMSSMSPISCAVRPPSAASSSARLLLVGHVPQRVDDAAPVVVEHRGRRRIGVAGRHLRDDRIELSVGRIRCARRWSMARFLVIARSQETTEPRRASKLSPWRQARMKASWATSSARSRSPSTAWATPNTRAWNLRTNATAASPSPAAIAASSASSAASCMQPTIRARS